MEQTDDVSMLSHLGEKNTKYEFNVNPNVLETFHNKFPERNYTILFETDEHTSLCPKTGQPDFATIHIEYIPDLLCIESKSLKLYLFSYRNEGSFMESITNRILEDLVRCCKPRVMEVRGEFKARGGITTTIRVDYRKE